jgi:hypothetical protein
VHITDQIASFGVSATGESQKVTEILVYFRSDVNITEKEEMFLCPLWFMIG